MSYKLTDNTPEAKRQMEIAARRALEAVGIYVEGQASLELERDPRHVDTGNLKNSITHEVYDDKKEVHVGTAVEYAIYVHEGTGIYNPEGRKDPWVFQDSKGEWHATRGIKPNHFLRNAVEHNVPQIKDLIEDMMK